MDVSTKKLVSNVASNYSKTSSKKCKLLKDLYVLPGYNMRVERKVS